MNKEFKPRHPRLRAMQIDIKRKALGIPEGKQYTAEEALEKAGETEQAANAESHFGNKSYFLEARRNWLDLSALLDEEERVAAAV